MTILRYPGGKSRGVLHNEIIQHVQEHYRGGSFGELFFGGGGVTIKLIKERIIDNVTIAERDVALFKMWETIISNPSQIIQRIKTFKPSVSAFRAAKERVINGESDGFDALIVNRLSHAGRGALAGPQGGYNQKGTYKIDCRWNQKTLSDNIQKLHTLFNSVSIKLHQDYKECKTYEKPFDYLYIDPPYYEIGNELYLHSFTKQDHIDLHDYLLTQPSWLLSYNNHPFIHDLYADFNVIMTSTTGNGGAKKNSELLIYP